MLFRSFRRRDGRRGRTGRCGWLRKCERGSEQYGKQQQHNRSPHAARGVVTCSGYAPCQRMVIGHLRLRSGDGPERGRSRILPWRAGFSHCSGREGECGKCFVSRELAVTVCEQPVRHRAGSCPPACVCSISAYSEWMNAARSRSIDMLETDAAMALPNTSFHTFGGRSGPLA